MHVLIDTQFKPLSCLRNGKFLWDSFLASPPPSLSNMPTDETTQYWTCHMIKRFKIMRFKRFL